MPPATALSALDQESFEALASFLTSDQLAELYREFLRLTRQRIDLLRGNLSPDTIQSMAHTMAGTAGMLGAQQIANLSRQLELAAADESFNLVKLIGLLSDACDTLSLTLYTYKVRL